MIKQIFYTIFTKSVGTYINLLSYLAPTKAVQLAYNLFSKPRDGKLQVDQLPTVLQQAQTQTLSFQDQKIQTYTWPGNSHVILLVHGWESNSSRWEKLLPYLTKTGSTIVALDGPAHGLSSGTTFDIPHYAEFLHQVVQHFKPQTLIGHSLGGKTCLYYQSVYQSDDLKKMVILGAPSDFKIILDNYITLLSLNSRILTGLKKYYRDVFQLNTDEFAGQHFAKNILTQGFLAHDEQDQVVLIHEGKKIATSWKNATFITTTGLGHSMHDHNLYEKISQFIQN
jgi:hypothetical protein